MAFDPKNPLADIQDSVYTDTYGVLRKNKDDPLKNPYINEDPNGINKNVPKVEKGVVPTTAEELVEDWKWTYVAFPDFDKKGKAKKKRWWQRSDKDEKSK